MCIVMDHSDASPVAPHPPNTADIDNPRAEDEHPMPAEIIEISDDSDEDADESMPEDFDLGGENPDVVIDENKHYAPEHKHNTSCEANLASIIIRKKAGDVVRDPNNTSTA
ncbi:hypothetical protein LEL_10702 [Akanthomyces lecanii RCEF 1005]|uniref:Uncharacterized protein n=1 Tax=Akanthomyces lecanii RCEF 1005 TaxID=1081108 RepID=A0A167W202_CORDF|nr:hypothetical protein LEL_10702 [Akanthomyces lecanii RCEF 1005]